METKTLRGFIGVGLIVACSLLYISNKHRHGSDSSTNTSSRKTDFGFKYKVNNCVSEGDKTMVLVDVDNNSTYVFADAKQYYAGTKTITENELIKISALEFDKKQDVSLLECRDLLDRYASEEAPLASPVPEPTVAPAPAASVKAVKGQVSK